MRIITGCLKSTPTPWLSTISAIAPPEFRREDANHKIINNLNEIDLNIPLKVITNEAPRTSRLKSRKPFYKSELENFNINETWKESWKQNTPRRGGIIGDPTEELPGLRNSNRKQWVTSNRLLTGHGRTAANMHR